MYVLDTTVPVVARKIFIIINMIMLFQKSQQQQQHQHEHQTDNYNNINMSTNIYERTNEMRPMLMMIMMKTTPTTNLK